MTFSLHCYGGSNNYFHLYCPLVEKLGHWSLASYKKDISCRTELVALYNQFSRKWSQRHLGVTRPLLVCWHVNACESLPSLCLWTICSFLIMSEKNKWRLHLTLARTYPSKVLRNAAKSWFYFETQDEGSSSYHTQITFHWNSFTTSHNLRLLPTLSALEQWNHNNFYCERRCQDDLYNLRWFVCITYPTVLSAERGIVQHPHIIAS